MSADKNVKNIHKKKNKKDNKEKKSEAEQKKAKKNKLLSLKEKYYKIKPYLPMGWKYFKKLMKTIRITDIKIKVNVGREDAHEAAVYYGAVQGALFNILGELCNVFSVKIKKADVNCVFTKNTIDANAECIVKIRPSSVVAIAFCVAVNFVIIFLKQKNKKTNKTNNQIENNEKLAMEVK